MRKTLLLLSALGLIIVPEAAAQSSDRQPPTITIDRPLTKATYTLNQDVKASYSCRDNRRVQTCTGTVPNGAPIATSSARSYTFSVRATDRAGNVATKAVDYTVGGSGGSPGPCSGYYGLTFDDGPNATYTPQVRAKLAEVGANATFFVVGQNVNARPQLVRDVAGAGHWVANHSYTHADLSTLGYENVRTDISQANDAIRNALGAGNLLAQSVPFVRPPYGAFNGTTVSAFNSLGLNNTIWTHDTNDWQSGRSVSAIVNEAVKVGPGGIILMHDAYQNTVDAVVPIVTQLKAKGMCPGKLAYSSTTVEARPAWPGLFYNVVAVKP